MCAPIPDPAAWSAIIGARGTNRVILCLTITTGVILKLINLLSFSLKTGQEVLAIEILTEVKRGMLWHFGVEEKIREGLRGGSRSGMGENPMAEVWDTSTAAVDIPSVRRLRRLWRNHIIAGKTAGTYSRGETIMTGASAGSEISPNHFLRERHTVLNYFPVRGIS